MKFVTVNLVGPSAIGGISNYGLGNQIFQIAAALSFAHDNNLKAIFPDIKNKRKYGKYNKSIFKYLDTKNYREEDVELDFEQGDFDYIEIPKKGNIRLNGYFQHEKYFSHNKNLIYKSLHFEEKMQKKIKATYGEILQDSISCHVRLGDYQILKDSHPLLIETNYYKNLFKKNEDKNILIFSDDIKYCKKLDIFNQPNIHFISTKNDIYDLYLMSICEDNILANSTFSWWAAWLNQNENKKVYFPEKWFGDGKNNTNPDGLFLETWIKSEC